MGYPMTYSRVVRRNQLIGTYDDPGPLSPIRGDLRRLEADQRDEAHLNDYAEAAGITPAQVRTVLDRFFGEVAGLASSLPAPTPENDK